MTSEQKGLGGGLEIPQICGLTVWNLRTKRRRRGSNIPKILWKSRKEKQGKTEAAVELEICTGTYLTYLRRSCGSLLNQVWLGAGSFPFLPPRSLLRGFRPQLLWQPAPAEVQRGVFGNGEPVRVPLNSVFALFGRGGRRRRYVELRRPHLGLQLFPLEKVFMSI